LLPLQSQSQLLPPTTPNPNTSRSAIIATLSLFMIDSSRGILSRAIRSKRHSHAPASQPL